ncbi:MAG: phosphoribosylamine--glycine ligase [Candidatus Omnitrophica bacterium]|nr:phosphoribosylamine--glycine ligase [Candidatus Omnitrophota bacterium]
MNVLVIGSGGREHALCWKIKQSDKVDRLYCAPGNGGISEIADCVDIKADDIDSLCSFAKENEIGLTIVGPEVPLVAGIIDRFNEEGLRIFGPDKYIAGLEGSKVFAKEAMSRFRIPTADFKVFDDPKEAKAYIKEKKAPLVIKADGLAAGKGVIVAKSEDEASSAVDLIMVEKKFGSSGDRIVIEDCLEGEEASVIVVTDGKGFLTFASSQDHKRALDDDMGPNTGGMGAYSPAPVVTGELENKVEERIINPLIRGFFAEGTPFKGVLYIGLMVVDSEPYALEFNVRFGDPETQAILPRLKTDLVNIVEASIDGGIDGIKLEWDKRPCICVVCASGGYPGGYKKGVPIYGLDETLKMKDVVVFHAGTKLTEGEYQTSGGRVLGITALGDNIKAAIDKAYEACDKINFEDMHYRKDIGYKALERVN